MFHSQHLNDYTPSDILSVRGFYLLPYSIELNGTLNARSHDCTLAVPRNCPRKINFVRSGKVENDLCGLYPKTSLVDLVQFSMLKYNLKDLKLLGQYYKCQCLYMNHRTPFVTQQK